MPLTGYEHDHRFYYLIGQVVVWFNTLEAVLREQVARLLEAEHYLTVVVLSRVSFRDLADIFKVTASFTVQSRPDRDELLSRIGDLAKVLTAVNERRNDIVHAHYGETQEFRPGGPSDEGSDEGYWTMDRILYRTKFRIKLDHALNPQEATARVESLADLESVLDQIQQAYTELHHLSIHLKPTRPQEIE